MKNNEGEAAKFFSWLQYRATASRQDINMLKYSAVATILATDCVGYSALMVKNEVGAFESVKACRKIIETTINEYGGRVFNTAGDLRHS